MVYPPCIVSVVHSGVINIYFLDCQLLQDVMLSYQIMFLRVVESCMSSRYPKPFPWIMQPEGVNSYIHQYDLIPNKFDSMCLKYEFVLNITLLSIQSTVTCMGLLCVTLSPQHRASDDSSVLMVSNDSNHHL